MPYAYTEQGIGQLSTVVHSKIAIERSIMIMNAFVAMRRFMVQNAGILMRIAHLEKHQIETDQKMDMILDRMDEQSPKLLPEQIFATGCVWDAWSYVVVVGTGIWVYPSTCPYGYSNMQFFSSLLHYESHFFLKNL